MAETTASITREQAIALAETGWWKDQPADVIVAFQLFQERLCMDFSDFHKAVQDALDRPVWTHEFASGDRLKDEFLGKRPKATFDEILNLIPPEKRIVVIAS